MGVYVVVWVFRCMENFAKIFVGVSMDGKAIHIGNIVQKGIGQ